VKRKPKLSLGDVSRLVALAHPLEEEANRFNIFNVFDDGGYRTLLLLEMLSMKKAGDGRLGDDACDDQGRTYELKTVNLVSTRGERKDEYPGVTTEHTLTRDNIARYRKTHAWVVGVFMGNRPLDVYVIPTKALEPYFKKWEASLATKESERRARPRKAIRPAPGKKSLSQKPREEKVAINNPKIPFAYVVSKAQHAAVPGTERVERPSIGSFKPPR
jgi:Restriction endonuclease PvuII